MQDPIPQPVPLLAYPIAKADDRNPSPDVFFRRAMTQPAVTSLSDPSRNENSDLHPLPIHSPVYRRPH